MEIDPSVTAELAALRVQIDLADEQLIALLGRRFQLTDQVGRLKHRHGMVAVDPAREQRQMERIRALAEQAGVAPNLAARLLREVIDEVVENHRRIGAGAMSINQSGSGELPGNSHSAQVKK